MTGAIAAGIARLLEVSGHWMTWNLILALAPWVLSIYFFRPARRPGATWVCGALAFLLLVPNAPYVLTDVIHLPPSVRREPSDVAVLLVVFPVYAALFAVAFGAYCDAVRRLTGYVSSRGWIRSPWAVELPVHALSAVAIYIGRIHRLNSWDIAQQPAAVLTNALAGFTRPLALAGILAMFACLTMAQAFIRSLLPARPAGTAH